MTEFLSKYWYVITGIVGTLLVVALHRHADRNPDSQLARHWQRLRYAAYACGPVFGILLLTDVALSIWAPDYAYHDYFFSPYFFPGLFVACWLVTPYLRRWVPLDRVFTATGRLAASASSRVDLQTRGIPAARTIGARQLLVFVVFFTMIGLFVTAFTLAFSPGMERTSGVLLVIAGLLTVFFSRNIAETFSGASWGNAHPLTLRLWGAGIVIVGVIWIFQPT